MYNTSDNNYQFSTISKDIVEKMLIKLDNIKDIKYILEPSAGKGNLVKIIQNSYKHDLLCREIFIDTIEINPQFKLILNNLKVPVIHDDFLTFNTLKKYDAIIMNPPLNNGEEHLLKAIEIQERYGGQIVCLLNSQTLKEPYNIKRKELLNKLEELNADIEYVDKLLLTNKRIIDIDKIIIYINIPEKYTESILFANLKNNKEYMTYSSHIQNDSLIEKNPIEYFPALYNNEILLGISLIKEFKSLKKYILINKNTLNYNSSNNIKLMLNNKDLTINNYIEAVRYKYWKIIFDSKMFQEIFTTNLKCEYESRLYDFKKYDITAYNIISLRCEIFYKLKQDIENNILEIFDEFSRKYCYSDFSKNIHYYNGWKTNKAYKINNKIILPYDAWDYYSNEYEPTACESEFLDIEKIFSILNGNILGNYETRKILKWAEKMNITKNIQFKFFKVTFYKKGTCHITFTDKKFLDKLNIYGSQKKGWLPPAFGIKSYNSMSKEEQNIIDDFCGKDKYYEIMTHKEEYLLNENNILKIEQ